MNSVLGVGVLGGKIGKLGAWWGQNGGGATLPMCGTRECELAPAGLSAFLAEGLSIPVASVGFVAAVLWHMPLVN